MKLAKLKKQDYEGKQNTLPSRNEISKIVPGSIVRIAERKKSGVAYHDATVKMTSLGAMGWDFDGKLMDGTDITFRPENIREIIEI